MIWRSSAKPWFPFGYLSVGSYRCDGFYRSSILFKAPYPPFPFVEIHSHLIALLHPVSRLG